MKQDRERLWVGWRCRQCGAGAAGNVTRVVRQFKRTVGRRVFVWRCFVVPDLDALRYYYPDPLEARYRTWKTGYYCDCGFFLARTVPELFQVFGGLLTREEALKLYDQK